MTKLTEARAKWQLVIDETVTDKNTGIRVGGAGQLTLDAILELSEGLLAHIDTQSDLDAFRPQSGFAIVTMGSGIDADIKAIFGTDNNKIEIHSYTVGGTGTDTGDHYQEGVSALDGKRYRRFFSAFGGWGDFEINEVTKTDLSQKMQWVTDYDTTLYRTYKENEVYSWRGNLYIVNTQFTTSPASPPEDYHDPDDTNYWTPLTKNINKTITTINQLNDTTYAQADNMVLLLDNRLGGLTSILPSTHNDLSICRMEIGKTLGAGGMQFIQRVFDAWGIEWQRYTTWNGSHYVWGYWKNVLSYFKTITTRDQLNDTTYAQADNMVLLLDNRLGGLTLILPSTHQELSICRMEIGKTLGAGGMQFLQKVVDVWGVEWQRYTTWSGSNYVWGYWTNVLNHVHALNDLSDVDTTQSKTVPVDADKLLIYDSATNTWKSVLKSDLNEIYVGTGVPTHNEVLMIDNTADLLVYKSATGATITPNNTLKVDKYNSNYAGGNTVAVDSPIFDTGKHIDYDDERVVVIKNIKAGTVTFVLNTLSAIIGGVTYNYLPQNGEEFDLDQNKYAEISYLYTMTSATTCDVLIRNAT